MKTYPFFGISGVLFEHPTTAPSLTILELMHQSRRERTLGTRLLMHYRVSADVRSDVMRGAQAFKHGFQNGGLSNCSGTELSAVTVRLKGKFTS